MTIRTTDNHRTKFDCKYCGKIKYIIKNQTEPMLAHKVCGWCTQSFRVADALINKGKDKLGHIKWEPMIVRILLKFEEIEPPIVAYTSINHPMPGVRYIQQRYKPIIKTVLGCPDCWNIQDYNSRKTGRPHYYSKLQLSAETVQEIVVELADQKLIPAEPVQYEVVRNFFPSSPGADIAQYNTDPVLEKEKVESGMYGPYNDRKGTK